MRVSTAHKLHYKYIKKTPDALSFLLSNLGLLGSLLELSTRVCGHHKAVPFSLFSSFRIQIIAGVELSGLKRTRRRRSGDLIDDYFILHPTLPAIRCEAQAVNQPADILGLA